MADFIFLGSKITADGNCSHEIKRCLLLGRKVMTNLDSILKSRDITFPFSSTVSCAQSCPTLCDPMEEGLRPPNRLLCPWNFPGINTRVACNFLLQGIFLIQGFNPCLLCLLHCRWILYPLSYHWEASKH